MANSLNLPSFIQQYGLLLEEGVVNFTVIRFKERDVSWLNVNGSCSVFAKKLRIPIGQFNDVKIIEITHWQLQGRLAQST